MIRRIFLYLVFILFLFLTIFNVITNPASFSENIINSLSIWLYNIYPALFTFYIIASCLINFNIIKKIAFIAKPIIKFETAKAYELFISGIFVGNPSIASLTMNEFENENITINDANKLIKVSSFFNPLFIITFIAGSYHYNIKYAIIVLITILITNLLIAMFFKPNNHQPTKTNITNPAVRLDTIFNAINQAINLLLLVAGIMVFANVLKFSVIYFLDILNINNSFISYIISQFEITTGLVDLFNKDLEIIILFPLAAFMFAFQGLSVNMQVQNIISDYRIKFLPILITRIIQGIIAGCITFIIINII